MLKQYFFLVNTLEMYKNVVLGFKSHWVELLLKKFSRSHLLFAKLCVSNRHVLLICIWHIPVCTEPSLPNAALDTSRVIFNRCNTLDIPSRYMDYLLGRVAVCHCCIRGPLFSICYPWSIYKSSMFKVVYRWRSNNFYCPIY